LDEKSQYPTLFYRHDRVELLEGGEFWLSKSPDVHLSKDWDSAFPRMMNHGLFREKQTGKLLRASVTHLDHMGSEARKQQAGIIRRWIAEQKEPVILMGDFNENPGEIVHGILTSTETGLRDTWQILGREESEESMTSHDFSGVPQKGRLDWILVSRHFSVKDAAIIRDHHGNRYPSDHFPYQAQLEWT
jgi:endonuclease/exonuclease/phosphatase family metal-dependent hydrolase